MFLNLCITAHQCPGLRFSKGFKPPKSREISFPKSSQNKQTNKCNEKPKQSPPQNFLHLVNQIKHSIRYLHCSVMHHLKLKQKIAQKILLKAKLTVERPRAVESFSVFYIFLRSLQFSFLLPSSGTLSGNFHDGSLWSTKNRKISDDDFSLSF